MPITKLPPTCKDPRHKNEDILSKIALGLVIAITFNTFTSAFLLFTFYLGSQAQERPLLKGGYSHVTGSTGLTATKRVLPTGKNVSMLNSQNINSKFEAVNTLSRQGLDELSRISTQVATIASFIADLEDIIKELEEEEKIIGEAERQNLLQKIQTLKTKLENLIQSCDTGSSDCPFTSSLYEQLKPLLQSLLKLLEELETLFSSGENFDNVLGELQSELQNLAKTFQVNVQGVLTETLKQLSVGLSQNFIYNVASPENTTTIYGLLNTIVKDGENLKTGLDGMLAKADPITAALLRTAIDSVAKMIESTKNLQSFIMNDYYNNNVLDITNSLSTALTNLEEAKSIDFLSWLQEALTAFQTILTEVNKIPLAFESLKPLTNEETNPNLFGLATQLAGYSTIIELAKLFNPNISNPWPQYSSSLFVGGVATSLGVEIITQFPEVAKECLPVMEEPSCKTDPESCFRELSSCIQEKIIQSIPPKIQECLPGDVAACLKDINLCLLDITSCVLGGD